MNKILTKEFLIEQYCNLHKSSIQIGEEVGCSNRTILNYMERLEIPRRLKGSNARRDRRSAKFKDLSDQIFLDHKMTEPIKTGLYWSWIGQCIHCGNKKRFNLSKLKKGKVGKCFKCKNHPNWDGVGDISGTYIKYIRNRAKMRNQQYSISDEYMWQLFLDQERKCALTGEILYFAKSYSIKGRDQTASLDRINSSKGYEEGNIQWLHKDVNRCKWDFTQQEFLDLCKKVTLYKKQ